MEAWHRAMKRVLIVIEKTADGFGAYAPDVPGVGVLGDTVEETQQLMRGALELHFEAMREDGLPVPDPQSTAVFVEVPA